MSVCPLGGRLSLKWVRRGRTTTEALTCPTLLNGYGLGDAVVAKDARSILVGEKYYDASSHIGRTPHMETRPDLCCEGRGHMSPHTCGWRLSREKLKKEYQKGTIVILPNGKLQRRQYDRDWRDTDAGSLWDDISSKAAELVITRLQGIIDGVPLYKTGDVIHRTDQSHRTDRGERPPARTQKEFLHGRQEGRLRWRQRTLLQAQPAPGPYRAPETWRARPDRDPLAALWGVQLVQGPRSQEQCFTERMPKRVESAPWLVK